MHATDQHTRADVYGARPVPLGLWQFGIGVELAVYLDQMTRARAHPSVIRGANNPVSYLAPGARSASDDSIGIARPVDARQCDRLHSPSEHMQQQSATRKPPATESAACSGEMSEAAKSVW